MAQASPEELLREGTARHARGDLEGAARRYRQVLAQRPRDGNALNLLGVVARQQGDLARALDLAAQAVAARPDSPIFLVNQGAALAEAGRLAEAARALRSALAHRPDDPVALRNLGQVLTTAGDPRAALTPLRRAVALAPAAPEPWLALAHALREAGEANEAVAAARRLLAIAGVAPALAAQARFLLAALGADAAPDRAPAAYVRELFDQYATRFDEDLQSSLGYRTPALLAALIEAAGIPPDGSRRVLDLGCGTGLSGVALRPFASRLVGLDLAPRMLAEAQKRGIYDALAEADLLDWLPQQSAAFDLVAAADVLNYLGDLTPALAAIRGALVPGGIAAFSIEAGAGVPFVLGEGMRYRHDPVHVAQLAHGAELVELARRDAVLREEKSVPVAGVLFVLRRN
ncbi:MAG TPA: tetratricopeptide repeat protein [Falsiroseomonas sp.]|jgi:predicted TPR repeat methyltransferase|nr:tetratricopeptide repeat protein [Falsiroseomonas sp.]